MSARSQSFVLRSDLAEVERLAEAVTQFCQPLHPTEKGLYALQLALEEAVTNVIIHGYSPGSAATFEVTLTAEENGCLTTVISDDAVAYDPLARPPVDTTASLVDREIGGLGVHFIKKLMDSVQYERRDGRNLLTLVCRPGQA
jgi:serine/threonine-protein kinase RsbW